MSNNLFFNAEFLIHLSLIMTQKYVDSREFYIFQLSFPACKVFKCRMNSIVEQIWSCLERVVYILSCDTDNPSLLRFQEWGIYILSLWTFLSFVVIGVSLFCSSNHSSLEICKGFDNL